MEGRKCTQCGGENVEPGFLGDYGQGARGFTRWVRGTLEKGLFGGARLMGRDKYEIHAWCCADCNHLELFRGDYA